MKMLPGDWDYPTGNEINVWDVGESALPILRARQMSDEPEYYISAPEPQPRHIIDFAAKLLGFEPTLEVLRGVPQKEGWAHEQLANLASWMPWPAKGAMAIPAIVKIKGTPLDKFGDIEGYPSVFNMLLGYLHRNAPETINVPELPSRGREPLVLQSSPHVPEIPNVTFGGANLEGIYSPPRALRWVSPWIPEGSPASLIAYRESSHGSLPHEWSHHIYDLTQREYGVDKDVEEFRKAFLKAIMPRENTADAQRILREAVTAIPEHLGAYKNWVYRALKGYDQSNMGNELLARTVGQQLTNTLYTPLYWSYMLDPMKKDLEKLQAAARAAGPDLSKIIRRQPFIGEYVREAYRAMPPWIRELVK